MVDPCTLQLLETSKGQQEEVLAYIEKKKKKKGMVMPALSLTRYCQLELVVAPIL